MAFTTNTSVATLQTFLSGVSTFATTYAGFTLAGTITHDTTKTAYILSKGGVFYCFYEDSHRIFNFTPEDAVGIWCRMTYTQPTTLEEILSNPGPTRPTVMTAYQNLTGPYVEYRLFTDGDNVHAVLEVYDNIFTHLSFGALTKFGAWDGGEYISANSAWRTSSENIFGDLYNTANSCLFDGGYSTESPLILEGSYFRSYVRHINVTQQNDETDFAPVGRYASNNQLCRFVSNRYGLLGQMVENYSPLQFNLRSPSFPIYCRLYDSISEDLVLAGYVPNVRYLNITSLEEKSQVETDWRVFPATQVTTGDNTLAPTGNFGFIYKEIPPSV